MAILNRNIIQLVLDIQKLTAFSDCITVSTLLPFPTNAVDFSISYHILHYPTLGPDHVPPESCILNSRFKKLE